MVFPFSISVLRPVVVISVMSGREVYLPNHFRKWKHTRRPGPKRPSRRRGTIQIFSYTTLLVQSTAKYFSAKRGQTAGGIFQPRRRTGKREADIPFCAEFPPGNRFEQFLPQQPFTEQIRIHAETGNSLSMLHLLLCLISIILSL
mgnify:CR=1 FL=1